MSVIRASNRIARAGEMLRQQISSGAGIADPAGGLYAPTAQVL
ncbi:MAG: hypothetical protein WCF69_01365 [Mycobacterium sp.]